MSKRYQVFVSSTYADLKSERQNVILTLMQMDCIPSGMELFPAVDDDQFEFIKQIIDDCDYYILIIGGRYGSISSKGLSYTELEYDYAISQDKKVIGIIHSDPKLLSVEKSELSSKYRIALGKFKKKVEKGRLVKYWTKAEEIPSIVALSLIQTIKLFPAKGWVRGSMHNHDEMISDLIAIQKDNEQLKEQLNSIIVSAGSRRVDSFYTLRKKAKRNIIISGIGMTSIVQYDLSSLKKQVENVKLDFLMFDPDFLEENVKFASQLENFLDISDFKEKVRSSFNKLYEFCTDWNNDKKNRFKTSLRVFNSIPTYSMVMIDNLSSEGELLIEFFMYRSGTHRPRLHIFRNGFGKELFDQIQADHLNLWKDSKIILE